MQSLLYSIVCYRTLEDLPVMEFTERTEDFLEVVDGRAVNYPMVKEMEGGGMGVPWRLII